MKKPPSLQILLWAIALILTTRLTWTIATHDVPVLTTITVGLCVLFATKAGCDQIARDYTNAKARRQEATR
ncbi:hypothetical protein AB0R01_30630 [Streptomyces rochei]|uniref:hypothetical protein n=1 Tax=Streptomyces TaxID=1883 RepID=UPI000ECF7718|nr:hypothetical protein [Streptomyces sp. DHE17-7]MBJ6623506.1 hypothetical protein [Streptomyces sp. DHE17-7]RIH58745.1 hypothetical protein D3C59_32910 [Streptomyces sp. SHP22-7]